MTHVAKLCMHHYGNLCIDLNKNTASEVMFVRFIKKNYPHCLVIDLILNSPVEILNSGHKKKKKCDILLIKFHD